MKNDITGVLLEVKQVQLKMALEVKRICEANDIVYSLIAGTLLGAVRHEGFIPWDDDIDLGMLRKDYNRFIELCRTELDPQYEIQSPETDKEYGLTFIKIMKKDTLYIEKLNNDSKRMSGIFIDIFPFDNAPDNEIARALHSKITIFQKMFFMLRHQYNFHVPSNKLKKVLRQITITASKMIPRSFHIKMMKYTFSRFNKNKTDNIVNIGGSYGYAKETIPSRFFTESTVIVFEKEYLSVFNEYVSYLELFYGDYMKLPPLEEREGKHFIGTIKL